MKKILNPLRSSSVMRSTIIICAPFLFSQALFATPIHHAYEDLGSLTNLQTVKNKGENYYKFKIPYATPVSVFFNGLSAGYTVEILDSKGVVIGKSTNRGTKWNSPSESGTTDGAVVLPLQPGYFFVHVEPADVIPGDIYRVSDSSYTLNLIPDNAPNTIVVAASNSVKVGKPQIIATGRHDNKAINQAIQWIGNLGGGRVLLRPGTYSINNNIKATVDNLTLMGTGWSTVLKLVDQAKLEGAGLIRSRFIEDSKNHAKDHFSNQHFMHMVLDGNKVGNPFFITSVGNYGTYADSSFEDIRAHDFPRYGLDPHESIYETTPLVKNNLASATVHLTIKDSLIDHNGQDGIIFEKTTDSTIRDNIIDANGRHGVNIVAESIKNVIKNNVITNNEVNGITIQPGADLYRTSNDNQLKENTLNHNGKNGVYVYRSSNTRIEKNTIKFNGWYGIHFRAASTNQIIENELADNSRVKEGEYGGINLSGDHSVYSTQNKIWNNYLRTSALTAYKFGIVEHDAMNDYNEVVNNTLHNIKKPIRLMGPHSVAKDNEV
ncbi:MAG: right-handed parallel beta-helix repeat-containing protein [Gammaproteobacteria bacterium]|nr:right-handed parallel beta-helix repeat-containing protein [Gammaproteobacteria bacterium]